MSLFAYIVTRAGSSTSAVVFLAACREKAKGLYLHSSVV